MRDPARGVAGPEVANQSVSIYWLPEMMSGDCHLVNVADFSTGSAEDLADRQGRKPHEVLDAVQAFFLNGIFDNAIADEGRCRIVAIMNAEDFHRSYVRARETVSGTGKFPSRGVGRSLPMGTPGLN